MLEIKELSILVVEPSVMQRKFICAQLNDAGVEQVDTAADMEDALSCLESFTPDLVISAMYFNSGTGADLAKKIKQNPSFDSTAFMLISSEKKWENLDEVKQAGAVAILPKPFLFTDLKKALYATIAYIEPEELELELYDPTSLKVLIVDDSLTAQKHLHRVLENMGITMITVANNGVEALNFLHNQEFDVIVTDYNMPEMDGKELVENIRANPELAYLPVLMVTSEDGESKLNAVKQAGVSALCDKPFNIDTIKGMLQRLLSE